MSADPGTNLIVIGILGGGVAVILALYGRAYVGRRRAKREAEGKANLERYWEFTHMSDEQKLKVRIDWIELKVVETLKSFITLGSSAAAFAVVWYVDQTFGKQPWWIYFPLFLFVLVIVGWWLQRKIFRGAPPHFDFRYDV
jgi:hypothetical protein